MFVLDQSGARARGFGAFVAVLELLPVSFLWAPALRLPGIRHLGDRLYAWHARRRSCALPAPSREPPLA